MEQQNKYRVIVSARAAQMLVSHAAFLAQVSPAAAERLTVEFEKAAKLRDSEKELKAKYEKEEAKWAYADFITNFDAIKASAAPGHTAVRPCMG